MNPIWYERFLDRAEQVASWSKDPSTKVGAVLVDERRKIELGVGYNGFPRRIEDKLELLADRAEKYPRTIHAEMNAVIKGLSAWGMEGLEGSTLFLHPFLPCSSCLPVLIEVGVRKIVMKRMAIWDRGDEDGRILDRLDEAGIEVICVREGNAE